MNTKKVVFENIFVMVDNHYLELISIGKETNIGNCGLISSTKVVIQECEIYNPTLLTLKESPGITRYGFNPLKLGKPRFNGLNP